METLADYPDLCAQLHPDNDSDIQPAAISYGSNKKVYWTCRKGHSYQKTIVDRVKAVGCPTCYKTRG